MFHLPEHPSMSNIPVARYLSFLFSLLLIGPVAADAGDDFSSNLFSDLAPLLSLFGERVTMQFMSQSMGWADNIILAMAPLGIITVIVSAIRVGGPAWLKAIVGRARENLAVAEAEIMSSTSQEVCELWNGQEVVRCMGSAPVAEFICLTPEGTVTGLENGLELRTIDLDKAKDDKYLEPTELNIRQDFCRWRAPKKPLQSSEEKGQASTSCSASEIIIIRNKSAAAPNISLNSHDQFLRGELRAAAVLGTILQLSVLVYSGFATYYPTLRFEKNGRPVADYAFPCTAAGILVLVAGMLVCAHVVESSTTEESYQICEGGKARFVWLQQTKTVNDQVFDSFAIFTRNDRTLITTSHRADRNGKITSLANKESQATVLAFKAVVGTIVSLCGFIVHFVGLRGMHFSASISQLIAVLLMSCLRAWVRRGLAKPPQCQRLPHGFELEWFAMTLADPNDASWLSTSGPASRTVGDWRIVTGEDVRAYTKLARTSEDEETGRGDSINSEAHTVMTIRRDLGELADWRGPASAEAVSLARAIEVTMDALFGSSLGGDFTWSVQVYYARSSTQAERQLVKFRLEQHNGTWKAFADEIEAALSLWLYSVSEGEHHHQQRKQERVPHKDDAWLRIQGQATKRNLRLLGRNTSALHRDLQWWVPRDTARIIEVGEDQNSMLEVENHRIVGCRTNHSAASQKPQRTKERCEIYTLLATESYIPLKLLYAQDMFSAFMWAAAETLSDPIKGGADIRPEDSSNDSAWQSFTLRNDYLSKMAHEIEGTGLGSLDQVYLSIIPPLSAEQKLPQADAIVELAKKHARQHEQLKNWKQAGDTYLWLFKRAKTFPEYSVITARSTAVLMEYLRTVTISIELRQRQQYEERDVQGLKDLKSKLEEEMKTVGRGILSHLMRIYEEQGRGWNCIPVKEARCGWVENTSFPSTFNFTKLHHLSQNGRWWELKEMLEKAGNVNPKDIHDWTPLHYAVAKGSPDVIQQLLKRRVNTNAQDHVGRTPLHVAAVNGHEAVARLLAVAAGADKEIKDHDGRTPLHLAAASGSKDVARLLAVQAGADREAKDGLGRTPLHVAAASGIEDLTRLLVEAGADKEAKDRLGRTPLHWAAASGSETVAWLLVEADADKEAKDNDSRTPLHVAAAAGHEAVVRLLAVVAVADKEARDSDGQTPLHVAATGGRVAAVRLLAVVSGADREAKDSLGQTPLHWAAAGGREAVTKVLVEAGADKEARDVMGRTPLHWAAGPGPLNDASSGSDHSGHSDVIRLLVEAGADKEAKDDDGETPLHRAAASGHSGVVRLLVEAGADKEARDGLGRTPLHWAAGSGRSGHPDVVRLLVEAGADKEAKDDNGETPLQRADALGHENVARLLITKVI